MTYSVGSVTQQHGPPPMGGPGGSNPMRQVMSGAASLLGMDDKDLRKALQGGSTLSELADAKGVSKSDLKDVVTKGLEQVGAPPGAQTTDLSAIAQDIIDGKGPGGGPPGPPPGRRASGGDDMGSRLEALTSALGMDATSFLDALKSGTSLSDLAGQKGLSAATIASLLGGPVSVDTAA